VQITRIKPGGWIIILLLLAGIFFGVRSCRNLAASRQANGSSGSGDIAASSGGSTPAQAANGDILVSTTKTKQKWMQTEIEKFNQQSQGGKVSLQLAESRDAMHGILDGKMQPVLWSPSSPVWVYQLANVWPGAHSGAQVADVNNSQSYRVLFKSPLVFLTTKEKAGFLRPLLSGPAPWEAVRQLSVGQRKAPWGTFRFAYADPLNASSGMLTMSLIVTEYAQSHNLSDPTAAVSKPQFATYLSQLNRAFVRDPSAIGSSDLEKAYANAPNSRDFITAYENAALAAVEQNPDLAMIYPNPTANADQTIYEMSGSWVTESQKTTASAFLDFLSKPEALDDGVQYYFRPAQNGAQALSARLSPAVRTQYKATYTSVDLPPYDALNEAAAQWRTEMKQ
jgi:hypothetical protein